MLCFVFVSMPFSLKQALYSDYWWGREGTYVAFLKLETIFPLFGHATMRSLFVIPPPRLTPFHPVPFPERIPMKSVDGVLGRATPNV